MPPSPEPRRTAPSPTPPAPCLDDAAAFVGALASAAPDWRAIREALTRDGVAVIERLLAPDACDALIAAYDDQARYRSRIVMARHGFGRGEYRYYAYPLPRGLAALRRELYAPLAPIANDWNRAMGIDTRYPAGHDAFVRRCHDAGQHRPTPLILRYGAGDYNCLHQDLYGEHVFPLQVAVLLSRPGADFTGGEFVLTEQRPRAQSRVEVVPLERGDAAIFAVHARPVQGTRGVVRVNLRHGVSRLRSGHRHTLGLIFHDAQ
ncbi:2OG-Fe(II) oxygenase [Burkholderia glumae]|uniref:2OG-Fe(II) oxygenase n=1 Tax=Burkholderia glumae TaxID=337 RepID=UPI003B8A9681